MSDGKHWKKDRPETDEQALQLLRYGFVIHPPHFSADEFDRVRTERRMLACADYFEKRLATLRPESAEKGKS